MNTKRCIATFLIVQFALMAICVTQAQAQTKVALVDIGLIFKNHSQFSNQLEMLKKEADQFRLASEQSRNALIQKAEVLRNYEPGSQEFKQANTQLAQEQAALEVDQKDMMRKLMQREARVHFETYTEVQQVIETYCKDRGIQLVLRYNSEPMVESDPNSIMQAVNGNVVFRNSHKDITQTIVQQIARLKGSAEQRQPATQR